MTTPHPGEIKVRRSEEIKATIPVYLKSEPSASLTCRSCGIPSSYPGICLKCAAYHELGLTVARFSDVMRTLELFGADDSIPKMPIRVCDLREDES